MFWWFHQKSFSSFLSFCCCGPFSISVFCLLLWNRIKTHITDFIACQLSSGSNIYSCSPCFLSKSRKYLKPKTTLMVAHWVFCRTFVNGCCLSLHVFATKTLPIKMLTTVTHWMQVSFKILRSTFLVFYFVACVMQYNYTQITDHRT